MARVFISKIDGELEKKILESLEWLDWERIIQQSSKVFIKPNFTFPNYKPGVTTSPVFLEALIKVLKTRCDNITIGETDGGYYAWKAEEAFLNHNLYEIKEKYDINVMNLYDSDTKYIQMRINSKIYNIPLPKFLLENMDVFISVPVLKVHSMVNFSFGLKNQWGCILDPFRMRFHHVFKEMVLKINESIGPKILFSDPFYILTGSGPMDGTVVPFNTLIASNDIFAFEKIGCEVLGLNIEDIDYLSYAKELGKIPSVGTIDMNTPIEPFYTRQYNLKRTAKDKFTHSIFKSAFLTHLFYYSKFGLLLHKFYYSLTGKKNKIKLNF